MTAKASSAFLNRELSWLEFNRRVLEEALDGRNPLLERLRFLCIFHSNMDEFFMVRVASLIRLVASGDTRPDPAGLTPTEQLARIRERVKQLEDESRQLYSETLVPALAKEGIRIAEIDDLTPAQERHLDEYFERDVYPVLTPIAVRPGPAPHLPPLSVHLAVRLRAAEGGEPEDLLALVQVPGRIPGLCRVPGSEGLMFCWLGDVIRTRLHTLFAGYTVVESSALRVSRDSEMELEDDDDDSDYMQVLEAQLKKRRSAQTVRLECETQMSAGLRDRVGRIVKASVVMSVKSPLDLRPLLSLVDMPGFDKLRYKAQVPLPPAGLDPQRSIFDAIRERDILLHHPYDSFEPVLNFLHAAAADPDVLAIKQTLYRTSGKESPVVQALIKAAESGKQVAVLIELKARFDEQRNIEWAKDLEDAGAHVIYGLAGLKVHAKATLVIRREPRGIRRYVHLGTGNYNERTARVYTDFGLLTAADEFGNDVSAFFNTITGYSEPPMFRAVVMSPRGMRDKIVSMIRREADRAQSGQISGITAKMNSLVDQGIIRELSNASIAGVPIQLSVRGICCLRPGVPGLTENIKVVSIVDRYLEHSRAFLFRNGGEPEVYLSSADWMPRNLDRRVELMFPIFDRAAHAAVAEALAAQFADNQKARVLHADGVYHRVAKGRGEAVRLQELLYRRALETHEQALMAPPVSFVPIQGKQE